MKMAATVPVPADELNHRASENEKISLILNPHLPSAFKAKPKIKHDYLASDEMEQKKRQVSSLKEDGSKLCDEFLEKHDHFNAEEIAQCFGKEQHYQNVLSDIYDKIENTSKPHQKTEAPEDIYKRSSHFINTKYQETCPKCSGLAKQNSRNILLKTLSIYDQARFSKKACLSFTTQHRGRIVQITMTLPCPKCCSKSLPDGEFIIRTTPSIEHEYILKDLLLTNPHKFVEECLWKWIDDHS